MKTFVAEFSPVEVEVVHLDAVSDGKLLRVQLLPISDKPIAHPNFPKGLRFDRAFAEKLIANFRSYQGKVPLDYGHGSEDGDALPEQAIAAGWFRAVRIEGNEVVGYAEPTPRALAMVEAKEYLLASAAITMDWLNPATGKRQGPTLTSAALTNRPFIRGMADVAVVDRRSVTLSEAPASRHADGDPRPPEPKMAEPSILRTADDSVSLAEHTKAVKQLTEVQAKLADLEKAKTAAEAKLTAAETEKVALAEKVRSLEAEKTKAVRLAAVDALIRETKATPAQKDFLLELTDAQFEKFKASAVKGAWKNTAKGTTAQLDDVDASTKDAGLKLHERAEKIVSERKLSYRDALAIAMSEDASLRAGLESQAVRRGLVMLPGQVEDEDAVADDEGDED